MLFLYTSDALLSITDFIRETEAHLNDCLQKEKRSREEEARQMQERASSMINEMEIKLDKLRGGV